MRFNLNRLLNPKSVALIGGAWTQNVKFQLERLGFTGKIWHLNPRAEFQSISDLPHAPDAAFIAVNRHAAIEVTQALAARGAGGAICFASGFEEAGEEGADLQAQLLAAAGSMPLLGPNCYGIVNYLDAVALWPDVHGGQQTPTGVGLITQSSNILINMSMQQRGLPLAYLIAAGNGAQLGLPELIEALDADPRVTAIGLHIEGFGDALAFHRACQNCTKPILALKTGETQVAQALTISHTASLSGSDDVASAFLARCGVGRLFSLDGLIEGLKVLHQGGPLATKTLASVSCSGGEASLMADFGARFGFQFPSLANLDIAETLNPLVQVSNPFDYHTFDWGDYEALTPAFTRVMNGPQDLTVFVLDWPRQESGDTAGFEIALTAMIAAKERTGRRAAVLASYPENMPEPLARRLLNAGLIPLNGLQAGLEGLSAAVLPLKGDYAALQQPRGPARTLTEFEGKQDLNAWGLTVPKGRLVISADDLPEHVPEPLVMKAMAQDLVHKSDVGGVRLNVQTPRATYGQLAALSPHVLMEEMVSDAVVELIIGLAYDRVIGGHLIVGAGGVLTEILTDTAILLMPFSRAQAVAALSTLKIHDLFSGYRGKPAVDKDSVAQALLIVQDRVMEGGIRELDLNPLMVTPDRAVVGDVLMVLGDEHG